MAPETGFDASEQGLRAPARLGVFGRLAWWFRFIVLVQLARLRFILILLAIGAAITRWDLLVAHYEKWTRLADVRTAEGDIEYFCPMHPTVVRDTNKEKCPVCFMPLSKRKKGEASDETLPAGIVSRVQLSPYRIVLAGVQTIPVGFQTLVKEITTVGTVEFDERGLRNVSARVKGRIDELFVNQTGQSVNEGDPLASLYSPDLVVTVQNLLDARQSKNGDLEKNARDRLLLWGIDSKQIDDIVKTGKPITHLTIRSPINGHIIRKYPKEGQYVEEGSPLYDVADLSTVWVQAQLYEEDVPFLPKGGHDPKTGVPLKPLQATATTRAMPGVAFTGRLSFIFPHVDTESRTLTVRFELGNPDHDLRPGMSANVRLSVDPRDMARLPAGRRMRMEGEKILAIPEASVIDTGSQKVVYRQELPGVFEGVLVELGPRLSGLKGENFYPVLKGLEPGDAVVTTGSFLIDAETRLNPALGSIYIGGNAGKSMTAANVRPTTPEDETGKIAASFAKLSNEDRALAQRQKFCPILEGSRLGSMGVPIKVQLNGQPGFVCCKSCVKEAETNQAETLKKVEQFRNGEYPKK